VTILPDTKDWTWVLDRPCPECDYDAEQDPGDIASELAIAAAALADRRSDGASFTVDTFSRYMLHDVEHHLWDVR
jgi:hypothetical protein